MTAHSCTSEDLAIRYAESSQMIRIQTLRCHARKLLRVVRVGLLRSEGSDDFFETRIAAQRIPKGDQFQLPVTRRAGTADGGRKLFAGEILVADPCSNHSEVLDHPRAIDRIFVRWQQF